MAIILPAALPPAEPAAAKPSTKQTYVVEVIEKDNKTIASSTRGDGKRVSVTLDIGGEGAVARVMKGATRAVVVDTTPDIVDTFAEEVFVGRHGTPVDVGALPKSAPSPQPVAKGAQPAATPATQSASIYTVKSGDTLSIIASKLDIDLAKLLAANTLPNPDKLSIGQVLNLPNAAASKSSDVPATASPAKPRFASQEVKADETLSVIAAQHRISVSALAAMNPQLADIDNISEGEIIRVPSQALDAPQSTTPAPVFSQDVSTGQAAGPSGSTVMVAGKVSESGMLLRQHNATYAVTLASGYSFKGDIIVEATGSPRDLAHWIADQLHQDLGNPSQFKLIGAAAMAAAGGPNDGGFYTPGSTFGKALEQWGVEIVPPTNLVGTQGPHGTPGAVNPTHVNGKPATETLYPNGSGVGVTKGGKTEFPKPPTQGGDGAIPKGSGGAKGPSSSGVEDPAVPEVPEWLEKSMADDLSDALGWDPEAAEQWVAEHGVDAAEEAIEAALAGHHEENEIIGSLPAGEIVGTANGDVMNIPPVESALGHPPDPVISIEAISPDGKAWDITVLPPQEEGAGSYWSPGPEAPPDIVGPALASSGSNAIDWGHYSAFGNPSVAGPVLASVSAADGLEHAMRVPEGVKEAAGIPAPAIVHYGASDIPSTIRAPAPEQGPLTAAQQAAGACDCWITPSGAVMPVALPGGGIAATGNVTIGSGAGTPNFVFP